MSSQSLASDRCSDDGTAVDGEDVVSDDSPDQPDTDEQDYSKYMPWIKVSHVYSLIFFSLLCHFKMVKTSSS